MKAGGLKAACAAMLLVPALAPGAADACSCARANAQERIARALLVVEGTVVRSWPGMRGRKVNTLFAALTVLKGAHERKTLRVEHDEAGWGCGVQLEAGVSYLLTFPRQMRTNNGTGWRTNACRVLPVATDNQVDRR